jgi:transcriptional regulator with XRE-family HTH domain
MTKDKDQTRKLAVLAELGPRLGHIRRMLQQREQRDEFTQADFARYLGIEPERYRQYERGNSEPPLWVLIKIKHLSGWSLDMMICGELPMGIKIASSAAPTLGDRIRWTRRALWNDPLLIAEAMGVSLDVWLAWENDLAMPPLYQLLEMCQRFNVTLDFLLAGRLVGIDEDLKAALLHAHPELEQNSPSHENASTIHPGTSSNSRTDTASSDTRQTLESGRTYHKRPSQAEPSARDSL